MIIIWFNNIIHYLFFQNLPKSLFQNFYRLEIEFGQYVEKSFVPYLNVFFFKHKDNILYIYIILYCR